MSALRFFTVNRPELPWGDYGHILANGMSRHLPREDGLIQLERTGPYVPPISFPGIGDVVVTHRLRQELESSGLQGLRFQPVIKKHIAHLDWQSWDYSASEPAKYPRGGEPSNYILGRSHAPGISRQMGELWEVVFPEEATGKERGQSETVDLVLSSWRGSDLFFALYLGNCATEKARDVIENHAPGPRLLRRDLRHRLTAFD